MVEALQTGTGIEPVAPKISEWRYIVSVMKSRWVNIMGLVIIVIFLVTALFAPLLAPYEPNKTDLNAPMAHPSFKHILGTDETGRDTLSRLIYGSRISLIVGIVSLTIAFVIGTTLGLLAGHFGGWVEAVIMRVTDAFMSIPPLVLMVAIATVLGGGLTSVLIAVGIGIFPTYCRLTAGQILSLKESDYITASFVIGANDGRIMLRHLFPNVFPALLVAITMNMGVAILMEASLSFLGIGIFPPTATWGSMVSDGYRFMTTSPILSFAPGISILLVVLAFNMVGDGLRDALDPRLRGTL
jgi:peptide/nickel transport system permease protein